MFFILSYCVIRSYSEKSVNMVFSGHMLMTLLAISSIPLQSTLGIEHDTTKDVVLDRDKRLVEDDGTLDWKEIGRFAGGEIGGFLGKWLGGESGGSIGEDIGKNVGGWAGQFLEWLLSDGDDDTDDTTPPEITCYHIPNFYIPSGSRTVKTNWKEPVARDPESGILSIIQVPGGPTNGEMLKHGTYTISFVAKNNAGLIDYCVLEFHVIPEGNREPGCQCGNPITPTSGSVKCTAPIGSYPLCGESCTFTCGQGYVLVGERTQTCQDSGYTGGGKVKCEKQQCSAPILLANMDIHMCTNGFYYNSVCSISCAEGYGPPAGVVNTVQCGADQTWVGDLEPCKDAQPPVFDSCPDSKTVFTERKAKYGIAAWPIPTASDQQDGPVSVTQTLGLAPGSQFPLEPAHGHTIAYDAVDSGGNKAQQCQFQVFVKERVCPPYPYSERLKVTCYDDLVWGSHCDLECNLGYPLLGNNTVYCEETGVGSEVDWDWSDGTPFCQVVPCPDLEPPQNGALSCGQWSIGMTCQMQCNSMYDISRTAAAKNGEWVCDDREGTWFPSFPVPDCTALRRPKSISLPNELFYFSGNCSDPTTKEQIKETFITHLNQSRYKSLCTEYEECAAGNVAVTCGLATGGRKKKKSTYTHRVRVDFEFHIYVQFDDGFTSSDAASFDTTINNKFAVMAKLFDEDVNSGIMDLTIPGLDIETDMGSHRTGHSEMICDFGMVPLWSTISCASCPTGTMYNPTADDCEYCAIGTFQDEDGQLACKQCPEFTSTANPGATKFSECIAMCSYGHYSENGLAGCAKCPVGTFQDIRGANSCTNCAPGTTTLSAGSIDVELCLTDDEIKDLGVCNHTHCNGGFCLIEADSSLHCICHGEYTGEFCEIPPDPCTKHICQNGGSCVVTKTNYTCHCPDEYTGVYCQDEIVNGGYTEWTTWADCSLTCGSGNRTRERECVNPPPGPGGLPCQGEAQEMGSCNTPDCPVCPSFRFPFGVTETCSDVGKDRICEMNCRNGRVLYPPTGKPNVTCGMSTNYVWSYSIGDPVDERELSKCAKPRFGETYIFKAIIETSEVDCDKVTNTAEIENIVKENNKCTETSVCDTSLEDTCDLSTGRRKRGTELALFDRSKRQVSHARFIIQVEGTIGNPDYFPGGVYNDDIATMATQEFETITTQMLTLAQALVTAMTENTLNITAEGQNYVPTVYIGAYYECPSGMVQSFGLCVTCPIGTYQKNKNCQPCALGFYQDREGMIICISCPLGLTTSYVGSETISECSVTDKNHDGGNDQPNTDTNDKSNNAMNDNINDDANSPNANTNDNRPADANNPGNAFPALDGVESEYLTTSGNVLDPVRFDKEVGNINRELQWPIIGGVLGFVILLMAVVFGFIYWRFKTKKSRKIKNEQSEIIQHGETTTVNIPPKGQGDAQDDTDDNTDSPPPYEDVVVYSKPHQEHHKETLVASERCSTAASTRDIDYSIRPRHNSSASLGKAVNDTCTMID